MAVIAGALVLGAARPVPLGYPVTRTDATVDLLPDELTSNGAFGTNEFGTVMVARLQAATSSRLPVLLLEKSGEGHGIGNSFQLRTEPFVPR